MLATVGFFVAEKGYTFVPGVTGPAIVHFQQAEGVLPFFTQNLIGFLLFVEAIDIARKWENLREAREAGTVIASIKSDSIPGDLGFDPLGLKPKNERDFKDMQTKELNNGRLAMMAIAGFVAQELFTHENIFK